MNPSSALRASAGRRRKWLVNILRFLVSAALLFLVFKLFIRWDDRWIVVSGKERIEVTEEPRDEGDSWRVRVGDTERVFPKLESRVEPREGFLSLFRRMDRRLYLALVPLFVLSFFFLSLRWWLLLRGHGFETGPITVFLITYIGGFFNNFLPGAVGGDIARAMIGAQGEERKAALVGTVLLDRLIGLAVMIVMATVCVAPFAGNPDLHKPAILIFCLCGGMILGYLVYFNPLIREWLGRFKGGRFAGIVREIDGAIKMAKDRKGLTLATAAISLFSQSFTITLIYGLSRALGIQGVHLYQFFIFEPIIFIVTAAPLVPGGWGVQEGAYKVLFGAVGVLPNAAVALSILYKLTLVFISLPGGILFALGVGRKRVGPETEHRAQ